MFNKNKNRERQDIPVRTEVQERPELTREQRLAKAAGWVAALSEVSENSMCTGFGGPLNHKDIAAQAVRNEFRELAPEEARVVQEEILATIEQAGGPGAYLTLLDQQEAANRQQHL